MLVVVVAVSGVTMTIVKVVHVVAVLNCLMAAVGAVGVFGVGVGLVLCRVHGGNHTEHMQTLQYKDVRRPLARDVAEGPGVSPAVDQPNVVAGKSTAMAGGQLPASAADTGCEVVDERS